NGLRIVITSVTAENYVSDFAFLVHKMIRMENIDAVFAIAQMENKIHVVARSRTPEIDTGAILVEIGGGGHTYAAAATIREKTLTQIEHQLIEILNQKIKPKQQTARDLMSSPPISAESGISCKEASKLLTRYNINALLVTDANGKMLGYITRQIIEKALFHKLDNVSIREYMMTEMSSVEPDSDILEMQDKIIQSKQRILPVIRCHTHRSFKCTHPPITKKINRALKFSKRTAPCKDTKRGKVHERKTSQSHPRYLK
ncbi:MAG: CBS domain-containing protein, partial [Deltaproteobacteria bacterium]|nr:CBS domain-containing protein [Deltaproteobacteria bacterium]